MASNDDNVKVKDEKIKLTSQTIKMSRGNFIHARSITTVQHRKISRPFNYRLCLFSITVAAISGAVAYIAYMMGDNPVNAFGVRTDNNEGLISLQNKIYKNEIIWATIICLLSAFIVKQTLRITPLHYVQIRTADGLAYLFGPSTKKIAMNLAEFIDSVLNSEDNSSYIVNVVNGNVSESNIGTTAQTISNYQRDDTQTIQGTDARGAEEALNLARQKEEMLREQEAMLREKENIIRERLEFEQQKLEQERRQFERATAKAEKEIESKAIGDSSRKLKVTYNPDKGEYDHKTND